MKSKKLKTNFTTQTNTLKYNNLDHNPHAQEI